jgi:molecular chaperone DnaK (HSP70)
MSGDFASSEWDLDVDYAVGIDLGTTYSCVAVYQNHRIALATDEHGHKLIPSAVAFVPGPGGITKYVGHEALDHTGDPECIVTGNIRTVCI